MAKPELGATLEEARRLMLGDRMLERGDPTEVYERAARIFNAIRGPHTTLSCEDMFYAHLASKLARQQAGHNWGNFVDASAYLDMIARLHDNE